MKSSLNPINVAILNAQNLAPFAVLSAEIVPADDGWHQLLPAGKFKARDGRPTDTEDGYWHLDDVSGPAFVEMTKKAASKVLIGYEHATLTAKDKGITAPAAAWLTSANDIEWRSGLGIYVKPAFTEAAKSLIDKKEIAYLSAVFPYNKQGQPLYLRMAALTNDPGLVDLEPIAALSAEVSIDLGRYDDGAQIHLRGQTGDNILNELLEKLLAQLGITLQGELTEQQSSAALTAMTALKTKAENPTGNAALSGEVDLTQFVPMATYNALLGQFASLSAEHGSQSVSAMIEEAKKQGKVVAAEVDYLERFAAQQGVAALSAMLEYRPAITALNTTQATMLAKDDAKDGGKGELTESELAVLAATNLTKEQFLAAKEEEQ